MIIHFNQINSIFQFMHTYFTKHLHHLVRHLTDSCCLSNESKKSSCAFRARWTEKKIAAIWNKIVRNLSIVKCNCLCCRMCHSWACGADTQPTSLTHREKRVLRSRKPTRTLSVKEACNRDQECYKRSLRSLPSTSQSDRSVGH